MKTPFLAILTLLFSTGLSAQNDSRLKERTDSILLYTQQLEFNKILDYTYPKLFSIAPRDKMLEALKATFDNEELSITLDSVKLENIYPVFTIEQAHYTKINHSQVMLMHLKQKIDTADKESAPFFLGVLKDQFGEEHVNFNAAANTVRVRMRSSMIAVKDTLSPDWSFVNYKEDDTALMPSLFSQDVLDKIKSLK